MYDTSINRRAKFRELATCFDRATGPDLSYLLCIGWWLSIRKSDGSIVGSVGGWPQPSTRHFFPIIQTVKFEWT